MRRFVVPTAALVWIAVTSALAFALMAIDKGLAKRGRRRIRERDLLLAAAIGGSPGTLVGILALRHKSRKGKFLLPFAAIVAIQVALAWTLLR